MYYEQLTYCHHKCMRSRYWMSIIQRLFQKPLRASTPCLMLINSAPKTEKPTVDFFWESLHQCDIHIYQETSSWSARYFVLCMVTIHKHADVYLLSLWFWGIHGYRLFGIHIDLQPSTYLKDTVIDFWVQMIIHLSRIISLTNMGHDKHCCI